ncbi:hypothetical protein ACH4CE_36955 [Streptomyces gelaticus]|uniref:hypothetical protein n=1 Tax=Streptomyces gelaticus TaxID=285446 RepID=UPI0037960F7B
MSAQASRGRPHPGQESAGAVAVQVITPHRWGPGAAAEMAAAVYDRLPAAYGGGLVYSRAKLLHRHLTAPRRLLVDVLD